MSRLAFSSISPPLSIFTFWGAKEVEGLEDSLALCRQKGAGRRLGVVQPEQLEAHGEADCGCTWSLPLSLSEASCQRSSFPRAAKEMRF